MSGGKLCRTATATVRLDPKLSYLCELAGRSQRRTKSSFIEWAVSETIARDYPELDALWALTPAKRLSLLSEQAPQLLTHEELDRLAMGADA